MSNRISELRKEYLLSSLGENTIQSDPYSQFTRWFGEAVSAGTEEPNAMVLSTADSAGNVSARVVLLKGIDENGFVFFSNYQSRKGMQMASNPRAALTFHWNTLERQIRVEGRVARVSRRESVAYFNSRPLDSRINACISPQSAVIPDRDVLEGMREGFLLDLGDSQPVCPDNWGGYRLKPTMVEFWQGRVGRLHDRLRFRQTGKKWITERLAP
ncbi:MAG: pyridoxamine 5'-phosphate oxidase [Bacteroidota bacterium]